MDPSEVYLAGTQLDRLRLYDEQRAELASVRKQLDHALHVAATAHRDIFRELASLREKVKIAREALNLWAEMFPAGDGNSYGPFHPIHKTRAALALMEKIDGA